MKKFSKLIAATAAVMLIALSLAGCSDKSDRVQTDGKNFTYWTVMDSASAVTLKNYSEMMFYQEMEKRTGVHIDFIHPIEGSTGNEAFIAMLTAGERPDMIEYNWGNYSGGPQQALDDEVIISLNDYLEEYAPNYYDYMEGEKGKKDNYRYKFEATTADGRYYGFNVLNVGETKGFAGIYVRSDLLRKWGMSIPETIDEWTAVFAKAKSEGFERPFVCAIDVLSFKNADTNSFNTAYNVGKNFYVEDGKVVFAPFQPGYKEYVAQMAEWMKAGYIDSGFVTNDTEKMDSNLTTDVSMASCGFVGSGIGRILPAAQVKNPSYDLAACPYPVDEKGGTSEFQQVYPAASNVAIGITKECGNYEAAIGWCDYIYSEEGTILQLFGIEGETYTTEEREDGTHYMYVDKLRKGEGFRNTGEALYHYMLPCNHPGYNQHSDYLEGFYPYAVQTEALKIWNANVEKAITHKLPTLAFTEDELTEITDIKEIAEPELEVALCDIILGKKDISEYDAAIKAAKENGYDRWLEIQQDAYKRFLSKE